MTPLKKEIENALNLSPQLLEARGPLRSNNEEALNSLPSFQTTESLVSIDDSAKKNGSDMINASSRPLYFKRTAVKLEGGSRPMSSHRVTTMMTEESLN